MSWSGPVAGAAPYQPQPFPTGQPGYGQPQPPQYGQQPAYGQYQAPGPFPPGGPQQRPPNVQPPKKKGNPVITRYPPPPGYRGPAQPQAPFGTVAPQYQNPYQPPQQSYPQVPPAPASYPNQGYSAAPAYIPNQAYSPQGYGPPQNYPQQPNYPQPGFPPAQNAQYPQSNYPPSQGYQQPAPNYLNSQGYAPPQAPFQGCSSQPPPVDPNQQPYVQAQGWQQPNGQSSYSPSGQYNSYPGPPVHGQSQYDPNAVPIPTSAYAATNQSTPTVGQPDSATSEHGTNEKPQLFLAWDDWDFDFEGAIWPKSNEPIDPNLSLGVIIWRPAKQVTRALPSTFAEAEEQALKPAAEKLGNGESVSMYFTIDNSHEAFLDVRQTDEWETIRHDAVFTVFKDEEMTDPNTLVSLEQCIAERDRPDLAVEEPREGSDEEMQDSAWNVMDNLEQALSGHDEDARPSQPNVQGNTSRSQTQEEILAMLGVTGSPKPPSNEPIPFATPFDGAKPLSSLPERPPVPSGPHVHSRQELHPQRAHSYAGHRNSGFGNPTQRPYGSMSSTDRSRPPPPPPDPPHVGNWASGNSHHQSNGHGSRESPARSEGSNRTLAGSDFDDKPSNGVDNVPAPTSDSPALKRSDSSLTRKRSYDDTDQDDDIVRQQDDHTRRKRRSQVAPAYSRR